MRHREEVHPETPNERSLDRCGHPACFAAVLHMGVPERASTPAGLDAAAVRELFLALPHRWCMLGHIAFRFGGEPRASRGLACGMYLFLPLQPNMIQPSV